MLKRHRESSTSEESTLDGSPEPSHEGMMSTEDSNDAQPMKYVQLDQGPSGANRSTCDLPPHGLMRFTSFEDHEVHYKQSHTNRCIECHKNFPTDHFLSLHIAENHDPLNAARRDKGERTYACFVEDCDRVCSTWQKRRMHLVDKHMFPRNYDFFIVNDGVDRRNSMLRPERALRRESAADDQSSLSGGLSPLKGSQGPRASPEDHRAETTDREDGVDGISDAMASLKFVPPSLRFGRKKGLSGFSKT